MLWFWVLLGPWLLRTVICSLIPDTTNANGAAQWLPGTPFQIPLPNGLVAAGVFSYPLPFYGIEKVVIWQNVANSILLDVQSRQRHARPATKSYDLWPKLTRSSLGGLIPPTYLIRFSLTDVSEACARRHINSEILKNVAFIFETMARDWQAPYYAFYGSIIGTSGRLFDFRLFNTGMKPVGDEKIRDINAGDLVILNYGRDVILRQTTPQDLIIFLGCSGSYFYYALNRPRDTRADRRQAFLLPISQAELWTAHTPLDLLAGREEYSTFVQEQLRPIFRAAGRVNRVILVDYTLRGTTILGVQKMFRDNNVWRGDLYYINIESPNDPGYPSALPTVTKLRPISIESFEDTMALTAGLFGRVVPPYPWFYWDVPPDAVQWAGKGGATAVVNAIRRNRLPAAAADASDIATFPAIGSIRNTSLSYGNVSLAGVDNSTQIAYVQNSTDEDPSGANKGQAPDPSSVPVPPRVGYLCNYLGANGTAVNNETTSPSTTYAVQAVHAEFPTS